MPEKEANAKEELKNKNSEFSAVHY